jgi:hypothetical protein
MFEVHVPGTRNHVGFFGGKICWADNEKATFELMLEFSRGDHQLIAYPSSHIAKDVFP